MLNMKIKNIQMRMITSQPQEVIESKEIGVRVDCDIIKEDSRPPSDARHANDNKQINFSKEIHAIRVKREKK